jgi:amidohydrolase
MTSLLDDARELADELTGLRHRLHRHPEIGLDLPHTQEAVLASLEGLGLEISTGTTCTSVTAVLRGTGPSRERGGQRPVVLLRGDMDALPITEDVDVPYRSQVDGAMHACGHDLHTSMLVGAARLLADHRSSLGGDVVFMFQPGEEGFDGAAHMIAEGVLDAAGRRADVAFALHVMSNLTSRGVVATRPGPIMAASDGLHVTVRGYGGHGSTPHTTRDPIPAACEIVLALQTAMNRELDAFSPAVLTVGTIHAGTKRNIIPDTVTFEATVRTFDPATRTLIASVVERVCHGIAAAHGLDADVRYVTEYPLTINDAGQTRYALDVVTELLGPTAVLPMTNPLTGSEDFSRVLAEVPGAMLFLGALTENCPAASAPSNHSPRATFDDRVLPIGAALYASLALSFRL